MESQLIKYFAYGSNMLWERLRASNRVPGAIVLATGRLQKYRLLFHKRSDDHSGKCDIVRTDSLADVVHGVVFDVPINQRKKLDRAEGVGYGYHIEIIEVQLRGGTAISASAYVADPSHIDDALLPYDWYHRLVIAGAEQNGLPADYIAELSTVPFLEDPDPNRESKLDAEKALDEYNKKRKR